MSQFDLTQLSKKNQEFVRIAKHQLIENGKTERGGNQPHRRDSSDHL